MERPENIQQKFCGISVEREESAGGVGVGGREPRVGHWRVDNTTNCGMPLINGHLPLD